MSETKKTITEPARETKVFRETDVLVVGGGPAGIGAALAAARSGARTMLLERYGHLGGLATGGLVLCIMPMSDGTADLQVRGLCEEIVDRLDSAGGATLPPREAIGSRDPELLARWRSYPFTVVGDRIRFSVQCDPELLKCVLNDMVDEAGVELLLHAWGCRALTEGDTVTGVVFESKSGRQAAKAGMVIDCTGDGDIFASAGAEFDAARDPDLRSSRMALVFRLGSIDVPAYRKFRASEPERYGEIMKDIAAQGGFTMVLRAWRDDVVWINNFIPDRDGIDVEDLTRVEVEARRQMLLTLRLFRERVPGFKNAWLMDTAAQVGVRSSRRLTGEHVLTQEDVRAGTVFEDTIAVCPTFLPTGSPVGRHMHVPYRSLLPRKVDNLLAAGRCFSSDPVANDLLAPIQFCIAMGQAAGTAAALAVRGGVTPRELDFDTLKSALLRQGVFLP